MKNLFLFFLFIPFAFALQGGETGKIATIDNCIDAYKVIVSGNLTIDEGEYALINCTEVQANVWECNCTQEYLLMSVEENTVNTYEAIIEYHYLGESPIQSPGRISGGGGYYINRSRFTVSVDDTIADEKKEPVDETVPEGDDITGWVNNPVSINIPADAPKAEPDDETSGNWKPIILWTAITGILIMLAIYYFKKPKGITPEEIQDETIYR